ncbi:unnamed protein product [Somion occarium]|uniref:Uncharacterized protein n=1 Tax=Somion occarium TaxID=3059160 RepID=A0ABP1D3C9_9APHY
MRATLSGVISLALVLASAAASPSTIARRSSACDGLGSNAFDDTTRNFLLGVSDGTTVNSQSLVVADPRSGAPIKVLGTLATHQNVPFATSFGLQNGALTPLFNAAGPVAQPVAAGSFVSFAQGSTTPASVYCAVPQDGTNITLLAVNGDTDSFALCAEKEANPAFNVFSLVYKPDAGSSEYLFDTCRSGKVRVIF